MTDKPTKTKQVSGYAHPIVGVGEAGQTHLKKEATTMKQTEATKTKKSQAMKQTYAENPRMGLFFSGWERRVIEQAAAMHGWTVKQFVFAKALETIPAEDVKAAMIAEMGGKRE